MATKTSTKEQLKEALHDFAERIRRTADSLE